MPAYLKFIDIENFKSYRGLHHIGAFRPFTAVVGPNASGKSNFMDAVSFVMGEKTSQLRVRRLGDLIHGASINRPVSRSASVTATFSFDDMTEKQFQRLVTGQSSEHRIDGELVSASQYVAELETLGINVKAKNFLVFQGTVESIALTNPKERTALFEEISGSGALKEKYDACRAEANRAEEEAQFAFKLKRGLAAERKEAIREQEEAEKYTTLQEELKKLKVELQLFRLYRNENEISSYEEELQHKQHELTEIEDKRQKSEDALKEKKKEAGTLQRELAKIEQETREVEVEIVQKCPIYTKAKERVTHTQKKLESALKTLEQARKAHEAHLADIRKLEEELRQIEERKAEWEQSVMGLTQTRAGVHLVEAQLREYEELKMEASRQSARYLQELDSVNREQKADQDRLDNQLSWRGEKENMHRQKDLERSEILKRLEKLNDYIKSSEQALEEQRRLRQELQSEAGESSERMATIRAQLEEVSSQLGDARVDKHEEARRKTKQDVVDNFKREVPGVYDRMINMCQPIHKRYNVAITKVFGKYMEAIVVDTEKTARRCIQILKERMLEPEIFLPLSYIKAKPLKERLRDIHEPKGVKLAFDVLRFEPAAIHRAVLFVTNNALVCETAEDAQAVAYRLHADRDIRYDAIALDGTFYQRSGLICGGSVDLERKAKRWDEKQLSQLKAQKEKLTEELREAMKKSRKESELTTLDSQIRAKEYRWKYAIIDRECTLDKKTNLDAELAELERGMEMFGPQIAEMEHAIRQRDQKILEIQQNMNKVEDVVFRNFCRDIGVDNIREYEGHELRAQQARARQRLEFDAQSDRINSTLDFERSRDTHKNVARWERIVQDGEQELEAGRLAEAERRVDLERVVRRAQQLEAERAAAQARRDALEQQLDEARRDVAAVQKDAQALHKLIASLEARLDGKRSDRRNLLTQCKIDDINIPLLEGGLDETPRTESQQSSLSSTQQDLKDSRIRVDYRSLLHTLMRPDDRDEIRQKGDELQERADKLQDTLNKIRAPDMRATQKLCEVEEKLNATNRAFVVARRRAKKAKVELEKVKKERQDTFMKCFEHVANEIDAIYKALSMEESAQALLGVVNPEEAYLDGVEFECVAAGKRFRPMSSLSGGERTVAALALLFAVHSYRPAPFFLLDEVDAALDNTNVGKVAAYIRARRDSVQTIVISLKEEFYGWADVLVGVSSENKRDISRCNSRTARPIFMKIGI